MAEECVRYRLVPGGNVADPDFPREQPQPFHVHATQFTENGDGRVTYLVRPITIRVGGFPSAWRAFAAEAAGAFGFGLAAVVHQLQHATANKPAGHVRFLGRLRDCAAWNIG